MTDSTDIKALAETVREALPPRHVSAHNRLMQEYRFAILDLRHTLSVLRDALEKK